MGFLSQRVVLFDLLLFCALTGTLLLKLFSVISGSLSITILTVVSIIATIPVVINALIALKNRSISVDLLGSIALIVAMLAGEWVSAAFVNLMITSARILDGYTEHRTQNAIEKLLKLRPEIVKVRRDGVVVTEGVQKLQVGDHVIVELGERVPVDGSIEEGSGSLDQSSLTGESVPVSKVKGDKVLSSTLLVSGSLVIIAEKVGKDTTLEKVVELVKSSQKDKAKIGTIADTFASWYIGATLVGALVLYFSLHNIPLLLSILLVACADDIAVATPLAFLSSIGYAARRGIIIKGGDFLEALARVKVLILDKTGTLTKGTFEVAMVKVWQGISDDMVRLAATGEVFSDHPTAKAIIRYAHSNHVVFSEPKEFVELAASGSRVTFDGKRILVGKLSFLQESGVQFSEEQLVDISTAMERGLNIALVSADSTPLGFLGLADEVKVESRSAIDRSRTLGVERLVMLTGDNEKVAARIASEVGITEFQANLLPEDKVSFIKKTLSKDHIVAMVGDGVNDAASLALADVGIAMGALGSDSAIEAADIALMRDDLMKIPEAIAIGRRTLRIVHQNFAIWGIVNVIGFGLVFGRVIGPEGAAAYNFLTDFLPLLNSFRLLRA